MLSTKQIKGLIFLPEENIDNDTHHDDFKDLVEVVESYGRAYVKDPFLIKENMEALGVNDPDAADKDDRAMT